MGLTEKEKSQRYRERLKENPEKLAERKKKKRESYHKRKRLIAEMKPQEKVNCRTIWRLRKQEQRKRKKNLRNLLANSPPSSPIMLQQPQEVNLPVQRAPNSPAPPTTPVISGNKTRGRKVIRRDRGKLYRENLRLKAENEKLKKRYEKYKKRIQRHEQKEAIKKNGSKKKEDRDTEEQSKNKRKESHKNTDVTYSDSYKYKTLTNAIKDRYKNIHNNKEKTLLKNIFQKLHIPENKTIIKDGLGLQGRIRMTNTSIDSTVLRNKIKKFFQRDDVSRNTAGKKETVTKGKEKVQKRFLLDSMKNLYQSFKKENPDVKCSYYYFTKSRPFYVVKPTVGGREMCLCKPHTNTEYKARALNNRKVIKSFDLGVLIQQTVCDITRKECMFGECTQCHNKKLEMESDKITGSIQWFEWIREEEVYMKEGKKTKAVKNVKKLKENTVEYLVASFVTELNSLKKHIYNLRTQYKNFRASVDNIQTNEAVILCDFSENYNCKCTEEIQAHHFGGSRQQVTLYTVVVYVNNGENCHKAMSFCSVSACNIHQPAAIWAHLHPIIGYLLQNYPEIDTIHFFSDGPFSQYRQKVNFYLACTKTFDYGFKALTWSFFEAGHGKGPADGIGGYLKRTADSLVATGTDIKNAKEFFNALQDKSKVKLFYIYKEDIDFVQNQIPKNIIPLSGTLNVHQLFSCNRGQLHYRNLSCFCARGFCSCLNPKVYHPLPAEKFEDKCTEESDSDNTPLSALKASYTELQRDHRGDIYKHVYGSSDDSEVETIINRDDEQPGCSRNITGPQFGQGDYLLVKVFGNKGKGKYNTYVCVAESDFDDDGEIKVTFLKSVKGGRLFVLDAKDISYVSDSDIIKKLPNPDIELKRGEAYYKFSCNIDIFEKGCYVYY